MGRKIAQLGRVTSTAKARWTIIQLITIPSVRVTCLTSTDVCSLPILSRWAVLDCLGPGPHTFSQPALESQRYRNVVKEIRWKGISLPYGTREQRELNKTYNQCGGQWISCQSVSKHMSLCVSLLFRLLRLTCFVVYVPEYIMFDFI